MELSNLRNQLNIENKIYIGFSNGPMVYFDGQIIQKSSLHSKLFINNDGKFDTIKFDSKFIKNSILYIYLNKSYPQYDILFKKLIEKIDISKYTPTLLRSNIIQLYDILIYGYSERDIESNYIKKIDSITVIDKLKFINYIKDVINDKEFYEIIKIIKNIPEIESPEIDYSL